MWSCARSYFELPNRLPQEMEGIKVNVNCCITIVLYAVFPIKLVYLHWTMLNWLCNKPDCTKLLLTFSHSLYRVKASPGLPCLLALWRRFPAALTPWLEPSQHLRSAAAFPPAPRTGSARLSDGWTVTRVPDVLPTEEGAFVRSFLFAPGLGPVAVESGGARPLTSTTTISPIRLYVWTKEQENDPLTVNANFRLCFFAVRHH